ncbi:MAG: potassium/proton antiporter [Rhodospirillales bacterium]|jgi:cell volume regulation protein A|nr:potassium/proton antiporter [Rhodospirillales bacterium]
MLEIMFMVILLGAGLVGLAVLTSLISFRVGAPLLLVFLGLGLLAGEDGLGLRFNDARLAYFVGSLALAVILFDSGFGTRLSSFRTAAGPALTLASLGVLLTALLVGVAARFAIGLPWLHAFLIGAIVSSTDAAAVFFLLRVGGITIRDRVRSILEVESASNDPMAIFLTITLVEMIVAGDPAGETALKEFLMGFAQQMGLGVILGLFGGFLIVRLVNRLELAAGLYPILVISLALVLFGAVGLAGGSGFLAVFVAGLYAGNHRMRSQATLRRFQDGLTWLAQIVMFLVLGLLATPSQFQAVALPAVGLALFLVFVGRPVAVWLCLLPFRSQPNETAFVSWVGLRGAVSILLAILPLAYAVQDGNLFFNMTFIIVLTSLLVQGWTIPVTARWLGLVVPPSLGPLEKVELELPGNAHHELVVYKVVPDSPVARGERVPRWARPSLVVRDGQSMGYHYAGRPQAGDQVYLFVPPRYTRLLDRLFASPAVVEDDDKDFFGEFAIDPAKTLGDLAHTYDVATDCGDGDMSIAAYIEGRLGGRTEVGDRAACGGIELVVREIDEAGNIQAVGLAIQPQPSVPARVPLFLNARQIRERLRAYRRRCQEDPEAAVSARAASVLKIGRIKDCLRGLRAQKRAEQPPSDGD